MSDSLPGKHCCGSLARQVGHVKRAVSTDVTKPAPKVVYRENRTQEQPHPEQPGVKFRRTVIDEVIVDNRLLGSENKQPASEKTKDQIAGDNPKVE